MLEVKIYDLGYCEDKELPKEYEMEKILLSDTLPDNLTYPDTYKLYFETVKKRKKH